MRKEPVNIKNIDGIVPIGQKVEVYVPDGNFKGTYSSYIYDLDDKYVYMLMPTNENGLKAVVRKNDELYISFVGEKDKRIGFSTVIADIVDKDNKKLYKAKKPEKEAYFVEFRENFRVEILTDAKVIYIKNSNPANSTGTVIDISASGAKLSVGISLEDNLKEGDTIFLSFAVGAVTLENVEAKIIRKAVSKLEKVNHYGLKFINLDKSLEEDLIKFCINRQLEIARKIKGM